MRLVEFYSLDEDHDNFYTIEPDGRLLEWEQSNYGDGDEVYEDTSYRVLAQGNNGVLIEELGRRMELTAEDIDKIEYNLSMGCTVTVLKEGSNTVVRL